MLRIQETVVVEGKYDKIRLSALLDANIVTTEGFGVYSDADKRALLRRLADATGLVIVTDSDRAGFRIRRYITGLVGADKVRQVYIPDVSGKEKRKAAPSKEGKLGVEGIDNELLLACFARAGITPESSERPAPRCSITKFDLYALGLSGKPDCAERRRRLLAQLELPAGLTSNALLPVLNALFDRDEFLRMASSLSDDAAD